MQNRDWRQARKRTAEGRFANDLGEYAQPSALVPPADRGAALPPRLQARVTSLADVAAPLQEDGELPEPPSVRIGQRLTQLGYSMPRPGALTLPPSRLQYMAGGGTLRCCVALRQSLCTATSTSVVHTWLLWVCARAVKRGQDLNDVGACDRHAVCLPLCHQTLLGRVALAEHSSQSTCPRSHCQ